MRLSKKLSEEHIRTEMNSTDHTDIINVQNGLLNIWTGELSEHSPDFLSIVQLPLVYNPKTRCPNIGRFLAQVLHPEDVLTALEIIGYLLYRTAIYEKAVMLYGNGDNGKGVFIKVIEAFVGSENCSMYHYKIWIMTSLHQLIYVVK